MEYTVMQLKADTEEQCDKWFMSYSELIANFGSVDLNDYLKVYEGEIKTKDLPEEAVLDKLFMKFNMRKPSDFKGHSMTISDIVVLGGENGTIWYCNIEGWKKVGTQEQNLNVESCWDRLYRFMSYLDKRPNGAAVELEQKDYDFFSSIGFVTEDGYIEFDGKRFCLG
jgi:hypothetical protein